MGGTEDEKCLRKKKGVAIMIIEILDDKVIIDGITFLKQIVKQFKLYHFLHRTECILHICYRNKN